MATHLPEPVLDLVPRPIDWQQLLARMDTLFSHESNRATVIDLDLDATDMQDTQPRALAPGKCVLLVHPNDEMAFFVQSWLAMSGLCNLQVVGDARLAADALCKSAHTVLLLSADLRPSDMWVLADMGRNQMARVFVLAKRSNLLLRFQAWRHGVSAVLPAPYDLRPVVSVLQSANN